MAARRGYPPGRDQVYVLVPGGRLARLLCQDEAPGLGPLAGPEDLPEVRPGGATYAAPGRAADASQPRGFFLDRYVY